MIATHRSLFACPGTACGLPEPRAAGLAQTWRGCFRFKCELNEEKNVSLGNSIGARSSDRCWSLLSHRADVLWSRIANYFRGLGTAGEGREVAGTVWAASVNRRALGQETQSATPPLPRVSRHFGAGTVRPLGFCFVQDSEEGIEACSCQHCFGLWKITFGVLNCLCLVGLWVVNGKKRQREPNVFPPV